MARRCYGYTPGTAPVTNNIDSNKIDDIDNKIDNNISNSATVVSPGLSLSDIKSKVSIKLVVVLILSVLIIGGFSFWAICYDGLNGASSAEDAVKEYITITADSKSNVYAYMPRSVRDTEILSDKTSWMMSTDQAVNIKLSDIKINKHLSVHNLISDLEKGYKSLYHETVDIEQAELFNISSNVRYETSKSSNNTKSVNFDVIAVKVGSKWYVYTGSADISGVNFMPDNLFASEDKSNNDTKPSDNPVQEPVVTEYTQQIPDVEVNADNVKNLIAGNVSIDNVPYVMPADYSLFESLFKLDSSRIAREDRAISAKYILKNLPVYYISNSYDSSNISVSIANATNSNIDVASGKVVTLHISKPEDKTKAYPYISLPGKVTLGTTYDNVVKAYGKNSLKKYDKSNKDINAIGYSSDYNIYQVNLANSEYNHLYLIFDKDNTLFAVRWQYYDLNI